VRPVGVVLNDPDVEGLLAFGAASEPPLTRGVAELSELDLH
jgi:hypothetical protein